MVRGYDLESKETIESDKSWTKNWFGRTDKEEREVQWHNQIFTTETICDQAMKDMNTLLDINGDDAEENSEIKFPTYADPEESINDIIDAIKSAPKQTKSLTKRNLVQIFENGMPKTINMNINREDIKSDPKMRDGGANRNITNVRKILCQYKNDKT